jgi:predicted transcriptional regulator
VGAGRPRLEIRKSPVLLSLDEEVVKALAEAADYFCTSKSKYAEEAIQSQLKRDKRSLAELKRQESRKARRLIW